MNNIMINPKVFEKYVSNVEMNILYEDKRQKKGYHQNMDRFCIRYGIEKKRVELTNSDYLLELDDKKTPAWVDTKQNWDEVGHNLFASKDRNRFKKEIERAVDAQKPLFILVESAVPLEKWVNPNPRGKYDWRVLRSKINLTEKWYPNIHFMRCLPGSTPYLVYGILLEALTGDNLEELCQDEKRCAAKVAEAIQNGLTYAAERW